MPTIFFAVMAIKSLISNDMLMNCAKIYFPLVTEIT